MGRGVFFLGGSWTFWQNMRGRSRIVTSVIRLCAAKTREKNSPQPPRRPGRPPQKDTSWTQKGFFPSCPRLLLFHVFLPPHPWNCERDGGEFGWFRRREARPGTHRQHFALRLTPPSWREDNPPEAATLQLKWLARWLFCPPRLPPWAVNPTVYPLYPGASADYSSPPCCVCLHRKNGKRTENSQARPHLSLSQALKKNTATSAGGGEETNTSF